MDIFLMDGANRSTRSTMTNTGMVLLLQHPTTPTTPNETARVSIPVYCKWSFYYYYL